MNDAIPPTHALVLRRTARDLDLDVLDLLEDVFGIGFLEAAEIVATLLDGGSAVAVEGGKERCDVHARLIAARPGAAVTASVEPL